MVFPDCLIDVSGLEFSDIFDLSDDPCTPASHLITLLDGKLCSSSLLSSLSSLRLSVTNICILDAMPRVCFVLCAPRIVAICYSPSLPPPLFNAIVDGLGRSKLAKSASSIFPLFSNIFTTFIFFQLLSSFLAFSRHNGIYLAKIKAFVAPKQILRNIREYYAKRNILLMSSQTDIRFSD
jgi:hypothetical protein